MSSTTGLDFGFARVLQERQAASIAQRLDELERTQREQAQQLRILMRDREAIVRGQIATELRIAVVRFVEVKTDTPFKVDLKDVCRRAGNQQKLQVLERIVAAHPAVVDVTVGLRTLIGRVAGDRVAQAHPADLSDSEMEQAVRALPVGQARDDAEEALALLREVRAAATMSPP